MRLLSACEAAETNGYGSVYIYMVELMYMCLIPGNGIFWLSCTDCGLLFITTLGGYIYDGY